jgi:hypothetical protein
MWANSLMPAFGSAALIRLMCCDYYYLAMLDSHVNSHVCVSTHDIIQYLISKLITIDWLTMQAKSLETKQNASGSEDNCFEEEVCVLRLLLPHCNTKSMSLDALCIIEGAALLNELQPDVGQHQGEKAVPSGPSSHVEGFSEIPKDVMTLKPVISLLVEKVAQSDI